MKFTMTIDSDNDALTGPDAARELGRLLRRVNHITEYSAPPCSGPLLDPNGNTVGAWSWES